MDINEMESSFNELQEYSDTQFRTIAELKKTILRMEEENKSLKTMMEGSLPHISLEIGGMSGISNQQLICETQLAILKDRAISKELTYEEAKKLQIYVMVLLDLKKNSTGSIDYSVQKMSDTELLKLVESDNGTESIKA